MEATLYYEISAENKDFTKRLLRFVRRNFWLYIPDALLIILLFIPPYEPQKILVIVTGLVLLGFRDLVVIRRSTHYLEHFQVKEQMVSFSVMKYNQRLLSHHTHIANVELSMEYQPFRVIIRENDEIIHQQYAICYWDKPKLEELYMKFNDLKKGISIETMFKRDI